MAVHHIFGRRAFEEPLQFIRTVRAPDKKEIRAALLQAFRPEEWIELISIPEAAMIPVIESPEATE